MPINILVALLKSSFKSLGFLIREVWTVLKSLHDDLASTMYGWMTVVILFWSYNKANVAKL